MSTTIQSNLPLQYCIYITLHLHYIALHYCIYITLHLHYCIYITLHLHYCIYITLHLRYRIYVHVETGCLRLLALHLRVRTRKA